MNRLQVAQGLRENRQLDLGSLEPAELVLVVEAPYEGLCGLTLSFTVYASKARVRDGKSGLGITLFGICRKKRKKTY